MKPFSVLVGTTACFRETAYQQAKWGPRRPVAPSIQKEHLSGVFYDACVVNDVRAAAGVLALIEKRVARGAFDDEREGRQETLYLRRMYGELDRRRLMATPEHDPSRAPSGNPPR